MTEGDPRKLFISYRDSLSFLRQVHATQPMHIGSEAITKHIATWPFPKRSPIYPSMDWMSVWRAKTELELLRKTLFYRVTQVSEVGLIQLWKKKAMELKPKHPANRYQVSSSVLIKPEQTLEPFPLEDFYSVFVVFSFGITFSVLVFIWEVIYFLLWKRSFGSATCSWGSYLISRIKRAHSDPMELLPAWSIQTALQFFEQLSYIQFRLQQKAERIDLILNSFIFLGQVK